jgi:hypothetical protein
MTRPKEHLGNLHCGPPSWGLTRARVWVVSTALRWHVAYRAHGRDLGWGNLPGGAAEGSEPSCLTATKHDTEIVRGTRAPGIEPAR